MAWVERYSTGNSGANTLTYSPLLPVHSSGDLILACLTQRSGGTAILVSAGSGWTLIGTQAQSGNSRQVWYWKVAESSNEIVTFSGTSTTWTFIGVIVKGFDSTSPIHGSPTRTDWNNVNTITNGSLTTTADNCLVICSWGSDGQPILVMDHDEMVFLGFSTYGESAICGCANQPTAGSVPTKTIWSSSSTEGGNAWVIAISDATTGGGLSPTLSNWYNPIHRGGTISDGVGTAPTWSLLSTITGLTAIDGTNVGSAITATNSITAAITNITSSENANVWAGAVTSLPRGTTDLTSTELSLSFSVPTTLSSVIYGPRGAVIIFVDTDNNWAAYTLAVYRNFIQSTPQNIVIHTSVSPDYTSSSSINWANVNRVGYMYDRLASTVARSIEVSNLLSRNSLLVTGGSVSSPCKMSYIPFVTNNTWAIDTLAPKQGNSQSILKSPVQLGDGATQTYINLSRESTELPNAYNRISSHSWRVPIDYVDIKIKTSSADTFIAENFTLSTTQSAKLTFDPACSALATYRTSGWSIIGFLVTWQTNVPCSQVFFIGCKEIDGKAAAFTNCTILASTGTHALALDAGGSVSGTSFTKGQDTYALNLREAGAYNLSGATFSGYTTPVHVTAISGTVTITLADADSAPDYVSDGATVVIAPKTVPISISGMIEGSSLAIYKNSDWSEIVSPNTIGATGAYSTSFTYTSPVSVTVTVRKASSGTKYLPYSAQGVISGSGLSMIVSQVPSTVLNN